MEIKCVKKEKIEYPKINEISNKKLKTYIPNKWIKLGVTSFIFNVLMHSKAFAKAPADIMYDDNIMATAGLLPIYNYIRVVSLIPALTFIISAIMIIIKKSKAKKQGENIKISKKIKIVFIISIVLLILSRIGLYIYQQF